MEHVPHSTLLEANKVKSLIEPHFHKNLNSECYEHKIIKANQLLTWNRFDIAFKLLYLEGFNYNLNFSKKIYSEHIRAFSLGGFTEPGNEEKNSIEKYIESFKDTFLNIKNSGFNCNETIIPLSKNNSIADGSHRVASSIFLNKNVNCINIEISDQIYNYKFFYDRNVPIEILDIVATKFVEYAPKVYIALVWPEAIGKDEDIEEIIPNIIYKKEVKLIVNGAKNLLAQVYSNEPWIGNVENNFSGITSKLNMCFNDLNPLRAIAFHADSFNDVLQIKSKIRSIYGIEKSSVHITDTKQEAIRISRMVFNKNSIHFLNYAYPNRYLSTFKKLEKYTSFINNNNLLKDDLVLDGGMVLSLYGLREAGDIDCLLIGSDFAINDDELEFHDDELKFHDEEKVNLIVNQNFYFYFYDFKFISFHQVFKMKKRRGGKKDINDIKIMKLLIGGNKINLVIARCNQWMYYEAIKFKKKYNLRKRTMVFLKTIGLYIIARDVYRIFKGKNRI